jgi:PAS domain S-box-containing protein
MHEIIMPERFKSAHLAGLHKYLKTGEGPVLNKTIEIFAIRKDKTEFPIELSISTSRSGGEQIFIAFINDITERKKNEDEIRQTRDFLNSILENIPNMVFVKDAKDLRFVSFNKAGEQLLGYSKSDLIGKNDYDFFPKKQADFFTGKDREVLSKRDVSDIPEEPINTAKGELWLHTKKIPVFDETGKAVYLLGISEDITERKRNEEKIKRLNKELLNNISQLESSNKELESFSYSVSHDLRAPLRAIHGYSSILMEEYSKSFDEEGKNMMVSIQMNAKKMGQLIDDLLAFSRLGKKELQKKPVDMNKLVNTVIPEVTSFYPTVKPEFVIHNMPIASVDYNLMAQVFTNLISNAIKYSARVTTPLIEIGGEENGKKITYYVKDNGIGFNMDYYNKLFGVFQRLHDAGEYEGTGVGLAIVKRIITKHGGEVWAESEPGKGATFYFSLNKTKKPSKQKHNE